MVCDDTLRIKNLPKELSDEEKEEFLRHFGAIQVKIITAHFKQKSIAYAKFSSKEIAKSVMLRLHQVSILNSRLCIEFAERDVTEHQMPHSGIENSYKENKEHFKSFLHKLNAWNSYVSFNQPPPPHLKYAYPKPNRATINNIAHALASVPKFYTQVLHLMNKMNLPPPFSVVLDPPQVRNQEVTKANLLEEDQSKLKEESSESELESDPENKDIKEVIPKKRTLSQKKCVKRPKFMKTPVIQQGTNLKIVEKAEDVFEKVDLQIHKKIEFKVSTDSLEQKIAHVEKPESSTEQQKVEISKIQTENVLQNTFITEEELSANRLLPSELEIFPVFKNYQAGVPTCRLYIKNIAKTVKLDDLEYIYKRYTEDLESEDKETQFTIRLLQEGRMKGQAFVTLDSVELAEKAVKETNGYRLRSKPLVVVFARSCIPKK